MPYWNEIPGAGERPTPWNRSRRKGNKHGMALGIAIMSVYAVKQGSDTYSAHPLMATLNLIAAICVAGPLGGFMLLGPLLGWLYQWRLIRYRERNGIPSPTPHSYGGDKWLELDNDDPLRAVVDARLNARR